MEMCKPLQDHPHMSCLHPTPTCPLNFFQINVGIFTALEEIISPDSVRPGKFKLLEGFSQVKSSRVQLSPVKPYLLQILHHDDPLLLGLGHQDAAAAANSPAEEAPAPGSLFLVVAIGIVYPGVDLHQGCPLFLTDQPH